MSDATIQARVQTLLQAMSDFDSASVTLGDYRILDIGNPPYAVILSGPFEQERNMPAQNVGVIWTVHIDLFAKFLDDDYSNATTIRQNVKDTLDAYPALNSLSGVVHALITGSSELLETRPRGGSEYPQFVGFRLTLQIYEFAAGGT